MPWNGSRPVTTWCCWSTRPNIVGPWRQWNLRGWAATQLKLKDRLLAALRQDGPAYAILLERLPGSVMLAWDEWWQSGGDLEVVGGRGSLRARIARVLEREYEALPRPKRPTGTVMAPPPFSQPGVDASVIPDSVPPLDWFIMREEALAELEALVAKAGLTGNEAEILALVRREMPDAAIATRLGRHIGTVATYKHRIRDKLRRAARPI